MPRGVFPGLGDPDLDAGLAIDYNGVMQDEAVARVLDKTKRMRATLRKVQHDWRMQIYTKDYDIVEEFERDPFKFLDNDAHLAVDLKHAFNRQVGRLSGGMKRRVSLAISLLGNPSIVFLDEVRGGCDEPP